MIQCTVKDPRSPAVFKVQQVINGQVHSYKTKPEVEEVIQKECEVRFTLGHRAPVTKNFLAKQLRYLSDEDLAKSIIEGTFDIPTNLDKATRLILKEIGKMGLNIKNGKGKEIIITPEDFIKF